MYIYANHINSGTTENDKQIFNLLGYAKDT